MSACNVISLRRDLWMFSASFAGPRRIFTTGALKTIAFWRRARRITVLPVGPDHPSGALDKLSCKCSAPLHLHPVSVYRDSQELRAAGISLIRPASLQCKRGPSEIRTAAQVVKDGGCSQPFRSGHNGEDQRAPLAQLDRAAETRKVGGSSPPGSLPRQQS
jgi:hypothetical protein